VTVDRDGNIICEDEEAMNTLGPFLLEQGYIEPDTEAPETEALGTEALGTEAPETNAEDTDSLDITIPITGMDGNQLRNLVYILCGYQYLLNRITRHERFHISEAVIESLAESTPFNSSDFIERMNSFIAGGDLRGAAFSAEHVTLVFPLEKDKPEKTEAYMKLASVIVDAAKTAKRVDTTVRRPENEKYVLRSWLVRLGLGGKDFKAERNALIDGLKGYTAFRTVEEARKHRDKYAEIRKIGRELREGSA
jgi:hypothetical protein